MADSRPSWYRDGLRFACRQCGGCCRIEGYVWVDEEAIRRLAEHLGLSVDAFGRRYLRRVEDRFSLVERANHECVFWRDGCEVYEARPPQCRTFPFWPRLISRPETWAEAADTCQGIGGGRLYAAEEIAELASGRGATDDGAPQRTACGCEEK